MERIGLLTTLNFNPVSMNWTKLLWSIVLFGGLILLLAIISSKATDQLGPGFAFFSWMLIVWIGVSIFSLAVLLLRLFRIAVHSNSFVYILAGTGSLIFGGLGLFYIVGSKDNLFPYIAAFILNILLSTYIFWDVFIRINVSKRNR